jgi:hypothetical protein
VRVRVSLRVRVRVRGRVRVRFSVAAISITITFAVVSVSIASDDVSVSSVFFCYSSDDGLPQERFFAFSAAAHLLDCSRQLLNDSLPGTYI